MGPGRAGFVLAGGRSTRMGRHKALLSAGQRYLVEHIAACVARAAGNITLIGGWLVARDMPKLTSEFLESLVKAAGGSAGPEPLCAVYRRRMWSAAELAIHQGLLKMHDFISGPNACEWPVPDAASFKNAGSPQEWEPR